jgi:hypothetical protein
MTDFRAKYQQLYRTERSVLEHNRAVIVPADIERVSEHEPCFLCGQARGCRHRWAA